MQCRQPTIRLTPRSIGRYGRADHSRLDRKWLRLLLRRDTIYVLARCWNSLVEAPLIRASHQTPTMRSVHELFHSLCIKPTPPSANCWCSFASSAQCGSNFLVTNTIKNHCRVKPPFHESSFEPA